MNNKNKMQGGAGSKDLLGRMGNRDQIWIVDQINAPDLITQRAYKRTLESVFFNFKRNFLSFPSLQRKRLCPLSRMPIIFPGEISGSGAVADHPQGRYRRVGMKKIFFFLNLFQFQKPFLFFFSFLHSKIKKLLKRTLRSEKQNYYLSWFLMVVSVLWFYGLWVLCVVDFLLCSGYWFVALIW